MDEKETSVQNSENISVFTKEVSIENKFVSHDKENSQKSEEIEMMKMEVDEVPNLDEADTLNKEGSISSDTDCKDIIEDKTNLVKSELSENTESQNSNNDVVYSNETDENQSKECISTTSNDEEFSEEINQNNINSSLNIPEENITEDTNLIELARISWSSTKDCQQYTRGCVWSPDGTCILTAINFDGMQIFELPTDIYENDNISTKRDLNILKPAIHVKECGTVYDYNWFPFMNSTDPASCCWIASRQHEPIHMWDAFTGELRCSYRGYDQFDEVETSISTIFSCDGQQVIGGFKKSIKIFNTNIPGRDYSEINTKRAISTMAIHFSHPDILLAGSWNSTINLYDLRSLELGCLTTIKGHNGGITLLKILNNGQSIFSGARKENSLFEWDLRNFTKPVRKLERVVSTNQRIYFDLSPSENYIGTGGTDGIVRIWNLKEEHNNDLQFPLHNDCCNGFGFHPHKSVICTTSGQYRFPEQEIKDFDDSADNIKIEITYENSLVLWWYGKNS